MVLSTVYTACLKKDNREFLTETFRSFFSHKLLGVFSPEENTGLHAALMPGVLYSCATQRLTANGESLTLDEKRPTEFGFIDAFFFGTKNYNRAE